MAYFHIYNLAINTFPKPNSIIFFFFLNLCNYFNNTQQKVLNKVI